MSLTNMCETWEKFNERKVSLFLIVFSYLYTIFVFFMIIVVFFMIIEVREAMFVVAKKWGDKQGKKMFDLVFRPGLLMIVV